ncbi:hypothetical protein [Phaeocystidibacter luteus]|uniref:Uncharacterized protein n=1 Tax=Phaeocystidibacter luteus TaxID=911197 RepID=A0A6N6RGA6_9FLAO|nr:hypothetical protein [Phaeocystidibacter luteus]KAB2807670.1 hypothetical protein F8C67_11560 [Phaeocystidibacter luteus]
MLLLLAIVGCTQNDENHSHYIKRISLLESQVDSLSNVVKLSNYNVHLIPASNQLIVGQPSTFSCVLEYQNDLYPEFIVIDKKAYPKEALDMIVRKNENGNWSLEHTFDRPGMHYLSISVRSRLLQRSATIEDSFYVMPAY